MNVNNQFSAISLAGQYGISKEFGNLLATLGVFAYKAGLDVYTQDSYEMLPLINRLNEIERKQNNDSDGDSINNDDVCGNFYVVNGFNREISVEEHLICSQIFPIWELYSKDVQSNLVSRLYKISNCHVHVAVSDGVSISEVKNHIEDKDKFFAELAIAEFLNKPIIYVKDSKDLPAIKTLMNQLANSAKK